VIPWKEDEDEKDKKLDYMKKNDWQHLS